MGIPEWEEIPLCNSGYKTCKTDFVGFDSHMQTHLSWKRLRNQSGRCPAMGVSRTMPNQ